MIRRATAFFGKVFSGPLTWKKGLVAVLAVVLLTGVSLAAGGGFYAHSKLNAAKKMGLTMEELRPKDGALEKAPGGAASTPDATPTPPEVATQSAAASEPSESPDPLEAVVDRSVNDGKAVNILLLGSDSRTSNGDPTNWEQNAQRSDAIMVMQISGDRSSVTVMSIPRDSWIAIPGLAGQHKINAAFEQGGVAMAVQTVESLTGIHLDHVVVTDFQAFSALTDALGGVTMTSATEGTRLYDGEQALAFVRERQSLEHGDFDRVRRHQLWMEAVARLTFTREVLGSPSRLKEIYDLILPYVAVDNDLTFGEILGFGKGLAESSGGGISFVTTPYEGTAWEFETLYDGPVSTVHLDYGASEALWAAFRAGNAAAYVNGTGGLETLGSRAVN